MSKRFTDTEIWNKEWYQELKPKYKCLWNYIKDRCDNAGVWRVNKKLAEFQINEKIDWEEAFSLFGERCFFIDEGKLFIPEFIKFQYGKLSDTCTPHKAVFKILDHHNISIKDISQNKLNKKRHVSHTKKFEIVMRDDSKCIYCQKVLAENEYRFDHVVPVSQGGDDVVSNIVLSCEECNRKKWDLSLMNFVDKNFNSDKSVIERVLNSISKGNYKGYHDTLKDKDKEKEKDLSSFKEVNGWKQSFDEYQKQEAFAYHDLISDSEWISERKKYHHNLNVLLSLEKAHLDYWSTEQGWVHKKKQKSQSINWKTTYQNALTMRCNQVWEKDKPKYSRDEFMKTLKD